MWYRQRKDHHKRYHAMICSKGRTKSHPGTPSTRIQRIIVAITAAQSNNKAATREATVEKVATEKVARDTTEWARAMVVAMAVVAVEAAAVVVAVVEAPKPPKGKNPQG